MNNTIVQIVTWLIAAIFGGGAVSAVINWVRAEQADKKDRKIAVLNDQIRNLYGPLYFFTFQNEKLFELCNKLLRAENNESISIEISNDYIQQVKENNKKIFDILKSNYAFIDPDDIDLFTSFYQDFVRLNTEVDENGKTRTPIQVYRQVGEISFMRPEIIRGIKDKFLSKKQQLDSLLKK